MNTISALFDWFLTATLRGSLLIPAVLLVQTALGRRMSAGWRHALWLPVLFVLGAPVLPQSPLSFENAWSATELAPVSVATDRALAREGTPITPPEARAVSDPVHWGAAAGWIWLAGTLVVFLSGVIACQCTLAAFRRESRPLTAELRAEVDEAARARGLRRVPRVLVSRDVPGPAMTGLFRPLLLLPASFGGDFEREERRLILLHEFTHVKRGDLLMNGLVVFLQALHWCNPLVWFAFARYRADRELACDSAVLSMCREDGRSRYGHALLKMESAAGPISWRLGFIGLVGLFGRGRILHSRIAAIAGHRRANSLWNLAGPGMLIAIVLTGATRAQEDGAAGTGRQILIETRFIEVPADLDFEVLSNEATMDKPNRTIVFSGDASAMDEFAKAPGAEVLSTPSVVTMSGQKATVEVGLPRPDARGVPKFVGTRLEILPVLADGKIRLSIHARKTLEIPGTSGKAVAFAEREIKADVSVMPGDTVIVTSLEEYPGRESASAKRLILTVRSRLADEESLVRERLGKVIIPSIEFRDTPLSEALAFLHEASRDFDPEKVGVDLVHQGAEPEPLLTVSFKEIPLTEALKYLAALSGLEVVYGDPFVILKKPAPTPAVKPAPAAPPATGKTAELAAAIILPKLEIKDTPLPDVLQYLQQRSVELDPAKQGLNFILNAPGEPSPGSIHISLSLTKIPLSEAMRYVAELSNLKLRYDDDAVVFLRP